MNNLVFIRKILIVLLFHSLYLTSQETNDKESFVWFDNVINTENLDINSGIKYVEKFKTIDVKSDNLTYLKEYKNTINIIMKATKKLFAFAIPLAVLSIFILTFSVKENSFLTKFIKINMDETTKNNTSAGGNNNKVTIKMFDYLELFLVSIFLFLHFHNWRSCLVVQYIS